MKSFNNYIINTKNIIYNLMQYKSVNKTKICAVVKADGYGLGVKNFVKQIEQQIDYFAVACFSEAIKLRQITNLPILILNFVPHQNLKKCAENNISITVYNIDHLKLIKKYILQGTIKIHLAINTGMNRIGFNNINQFKKSLFYCSNIKNIKIEGIYTHLYNSADKVCTDKQFCIFNHFLDIFKNFNFNNIIIHTSASDASVLYKDKCFNMVRLGILMYGYSSTNLHLKPALQISSKVINICKVKKGHSVGYGKVFIANKDMIIATVPIGYADGLLRSYAKKGSVLINNCFCKIVGNICMDMFMCDVTNVKTKIGDKVIILGDDKNNSISAQDIAVDCDTICYEILTNIKRNRFNVIKK